MTAYVNATITGRFTEDDNPDPTLATPLKGQVTIRCDARDPSSGTTATLGLISETPPRSIAVDDIVVALDGTGSLSITTVGTGQTGITSPSVFTYTAYPALTTQDGLAVRIHPYSFTAPAGVTTNLTLVAPVATSNGITMTTGPAGPPGASGTAGFGVTGSRPSASTSGVGVMWFDTTLGKPIWSNGTVWKDATGATV